MSEKSLHEIIMGIKNCLMEAYGAHLSRIPPDADGWTLERYLEALAGHLAPAMVRILAVPPEWTRELKRMAPHNTIIEEMKAEIAALKEQISRMEHPFMPESSRSSFFSRLGRRH